jgi:predicted ATPase
MDRLEPDLRETLAVASVEGEEFTAEVVARVRAVDERELVRQLSGELAKQHRLVGAQGVRHLGPDGRRLSLYRFRHNLFQKYLFHSLDEVERCYLHEEVGHALEQLYGQQTEEVAVQLARHFQAAGIPEKAVDYLHQAGERAVRLSANEEAIAHFTKALALLETLPATPERAEQELTLQIALGVPFIATKGYATPEVEKTYTRARELCQQAGGGETPHLFPALRGLWNCFNERAELETAHELGEQLLDLAQHTQDPALLVEAHRALGTTLFFLGEFSAARALVEQGIALYDPQQHRSLAFLYGADPGVVCRLYAAWILWNLGYPDQALQRMDEALTLARGLSHPHSLAFALVFATLLHAYRREGPAVQERAEATISLSTEQGFPSWLAQGTVMRGWALAEQGQAEEGIPQIREGLAGWRATGAELGSPWWLTLLAEAYGKVGQIEAGLEALAEALAAVNKSGERHYEAEIYRLQGELLLKDEGGRMKACPERSRRDEMSPEACFLEAESCFQRAIEVARAQQAKLLELRAVVSLARLWHSQGSPDKKDEARQLLADIYDWFTEGFDTVDLQEAKVLLEELSKT